MRRIETTIDIDASPADVWRVLTDFERYDEWNPFVTRLEGSPFEGERLRVRIEPPNGRAMTFKPRLTAFERQHRLEWLGRLYIPGLFDGRHTFELTALPDGRTRLTQREQFSGLLVGVLLDEADVRAGFEAMNEALAERALAHGRDGSRQATPA